MWELGIKFKFMWSLFLLSNCVGKRVQTLDWDWMQTGKLGMLDGGQWLGSSLCPDGSFVTGYKVKYGRGNAIGEITGLKLRCSKLDQNSHLHNVKYLSANGASISRSNSVTVVSNRQAVGFSMARWTDPENFEFVDGRKLKFLGEDESHQFNSKFRFPNNANATLLVNIGCPEDWAVCGMQARQKDADDADGEQILTQLRFKCCYYCIPQERRVILDDFTNPGSTDYSRTIRSVVGTQLDHRCLISGSTPDRTKETQNSNSKNIGTCQSEGETNSSNTGQRDSRGWTTGKELRISTSNQKGGTSQVSDATSDSDSRSVGRSKAQIDSNHWSQTDKESVEVGASFGFSAFGFSAGASINSRSSQSHTSGGHQNRAEGGHGQTEVGTTQDNTTISQNETNRAVSTTTTNTDSSGKDNSTNRGESGGTSLNKEQSRQTSIQKAKDRSIQEGAQSMFRQRQGDQKSWQFSWEKSDSLMWQEEREISQTFTCEAMHRCKIEQVYGTCGALRIGTTKIEHKNEELKSGMSGGSPQPEVDPETDPSKTKKTQWEINRANQTWVVAKGISHWEPSGRWENVQICPPETIVTGHMYKHLSQIGFFGIALICSKKYGPDEGEKEHNSTNVNILRISSEDEPERNRTRGIWGNVRRGSRSHFAEGYGFAQREMNGSRWIGNQEIIYHNTTLMEIPFFMTGNSSRVVTKCPEDHAICGLTAMKDKAGIGILTAFGFKCCHHCIPQEKWVTVHRSINRGSFEERKQVTTAVGITQSQTNTVNSGSTIDSAGLHKEFSARFGKSNSTGFDWTHSNNSIWKDETTMTKTYTCPAFSFCTYRKLVGQCGSVLVSINKFDKVSVPLKCGVPVPDLSDTLDHNATTTPTTPSGSSSAYPKEYTLEEELTPVQVLKNGEIWIEAQNIQIQNSDQRTNRNTAWGKSESCPLGSFVTGYRLMKLGGEDKNTKGLLTGLELQCSRWDAQGNFQQVKLIQGGQRAGARQLGHSPSDAVEDLVQNNNSPAVGFNFFVFEQRLYDDKPLLGQGHSLIFDRKSAPESPTFDNDDYERNLREKKVLCPTDYVICGVRTRKDGCIGALTDVKFQCCYHCEPLETEEELVNQQSPSDETLTHIIPHVSVGAVVEVKNPIVEGSTSNSFTLHKGFSDYRYIKEMFSRRLPKTSKRLESGQPKVHWKNQSRNLWTKEFEIRKAYWCKPKHTCVVHQVVGVCGKIRIPTHITSTQYRLIGGQ